MPDGFVQVPPDSTGKQVDAASLDVGLNTVMRQRMIIADNSATSQYATVTGGALVCTGTFNISAMPSVNVNGGVAISGTAIVTGQVSLGAGTAVIGDINAISRTVQVAIGTPFTINNISATVNVAGTFTIGIIDAISATVNTVTRISAFTDGSGSTTNVIDSANTALRVNVVAGSGGGPTHVSLDAGTANIGFIDSISRTVQVAIGTPFTINNISAIVAVSGTIDKISATVTVVGTVSLGAGTANIGTINNISAAVAVTGTVSLGAGTNLIGAVSLAAGTAVFGTLNNISATVIVAGEIANGASLSTTNKPVLIGGNTSAGGAGGLMATLLLDTTGAVKLAAGTNNIGAVSNAAGTALMGAVSLAAGTAKIGFIGKISATTIVAGVVSVGGAVNISVFPALVAGTANIGGVSLVAGTANIGFINGISQTISTIVLGKVAHGASITTGDAPAQMGWRANLSAPAANISNGASFGWSDKFGRPVVINNHPSLLPTASHGPKVVVCSTSAGVAMIAAPGAGLSVYITQIACTNGSGTLTRADVFQVSATASCLAQMYMAASGGGFVMNYNPPIQVLSNSGVTCRVKPSVSECRFNVHFYVGAK